MSDKIIFPDSDETATSQKVEGWVSREGRFYGKDEQAARWGGATHVHCSICGAPCPKNWTACETCRAKLAHERYIKLPVVMWDERVPVYSMILDKYYWSREDARDDTEGIFDPVPLQLVLCEPVYAGEVNPIEYYEDMLPDDDFGSGVELNQVLVDAFQELNDTINEAKIILSYEPTNVAVV